MENERILVEDLRGVSVVTLSGVLDMDSSFALRGVMEGLLLKGRANVVVDAGNVAYLNSSALDVLFSSAVRFHHRGGEMKVCNPSQAAKEVFDLVGLGKFISIHEDRTGALLSYPEEVRTSIGIRDRRQGKDRRGAKTAIPPHERRKADRRRA